MRMTRTEFALVSLAITSLISAVGASQYSASGKYIGDSVLSRVHGTNGGQNGGASANYSCDDVNAGQGQFSLASCNAATNVPNNSVCVYCPDVYGSGYTTGNINLIVFSAQINCGATPPSESRKFTGACVYETDLGHGFCDADTPSGQCTGAFNQFSLQQMSGPVP